MPMFKPSSQKIFDIIPPEKMEGKAFSGKKTRDRKYLQPRPRKSLKIFFLAFIFFLVLGGIFSYFTLQKAEITIWPKTQEVNFEERVIINSETEEVEFLTNTIPGDIFKKEQTIVQEFFSSGKGLREIKAEGIIRVYNVYSTSPQVLVATTRFISANGELFRSLERVTIPGGIYKGGKLEPGFRDIKIRADQPGEEYNIGPSTFSIPGFAGTVRYTAFYGKSFEPMERGFKGEVPEVTQKDLNKAENILREKLLTAVKISLENKVSEEIIILDEASTKDFSTPVFSANVGDEKTSFVGEGGLSFTALTFKQSDLENFTKEYILSQISKDQKIHLESLRINYFFQGFNTRQGQMTLRLNSSAKIYFGISDDYLKKELAGRLVPEAKEFLTNDPRITKSDINLWPFWTRRVPQDTHKIEIKQEIDRS